MKKISLLAIAFVSIFILIYWKFFSPPPPPPPRPQISITIPEGFSVREIDERLAEMKLISSGEFASSALAAEGYLFPDTYFVFSDIFKPENLIKKMEDNFLGKITPDLQEAMKQKKRTLQEVITMASMLEKETKTDYPLVAGILWKRLDAGWPLQVDATLLYGRQTNIITKKELTENTAYNTYKKRGLPPTPIGNPGLQTIRAAIFPEDSPYWFYISGKDGHMHYARTNEEQNENRRKYLFWGVKTQSVSTVPPRARLTTFGLAPPPF